MAIERILSFGIKELVPAAESILNAAKALLLGADDGLSSARKEMGPTAKVPHTTDGPSVAHPMAAGKTCLEGEPGTAAQTAPEKTGSRRAGFLSQSLKSPDPLPPLEISEHVSGSGRVKLVVASDSGEAKHLAAYESPAALRSERKARMEMLDSGIPRVSIDRFNESERRALSNLFADGPMDDLNMFGSQTPFPTKAPFPRTDRRTSASEATSKQNRAAGLGDNVVNFPDAIK